MGVRILQGALRISDGTVYIDASKASAERYAGSNPALSSLYALRNIRIAAGALLAVSLLFPFITGTLAFVGYMSLNGIEKMGRDAWVVVALSSGLVAQAWYWRSSLWTFVLPVLAILVAGYSLIELIGHVDEVIVAAEGTGTASLGIGIFTMVAAAIASLVLTHWVRNAEKV